MMHLKVVSVAKKKIIYQHHLVFLALTEAFLYTYNSTVHVIQKIGAHFHVLNTLHRHS